MVTIVSEHWRDRIAAGSSGRRLLLLPDCPMATDRGDDADVSRPPHLCGPGCVIGTLWGAAREQGWVVETTPRAVAGIGGLLTGQYDGILGIARLEHLEKAFAMLPAFALPIAAVPFDPQAGTPSVSPAGGSAACAAAAARAALDVEWVLGLLGVAGGQTAPVADHLPLLREAAELFLPGSLQGIASSAGMPEALDWMEGRPEPLASTARFAADFLGRGGKFLRPFITLASFEALIADPLQAAGGVGADRSAVRAAAVAVEVFHKASLIHDDIEDADGMRYGRKALHEEVGIPVAINTGDHLVGFGYRIMATLPTVDAGCRADLVAMLSDAHVRLSRGQGAELWWRVARDTPLTVPEALAIYGLKTSPAFEVALSIGVRLSGVNPTEAGAIDRYARHVGVGFQVLNDLKDWHGDPENARHAAGDLLGGRPTVMWALARERVPASELQRLSRLAEEARLPGGPSAADVIAEARRLYESAEVFDRAASMVDAERAGALAAAATCRHARLREVFEFLLDLAVPEGAAAQLVG
jgi:geranylgeranyl pyrophosphate synthase